MATPELAEMKEHIKDFARERIYPSELIPVGSPCDFCPEEGWHPKVVRRLSCPE
jgi:hypothetical protein